MAETTDGIAHSRDGVERHGSPLCVVISTDGRLQGRSIMQAIADREREISATTDRVVSSNQDSVKARIGKKRVAAREKMSDPASDAMSLSQGRHF